MGHNWTKDEDIIAYCCARFGITKTNSTKLSEMVGLEYDRQMLPRIKDYQFLLGVGSKRNVSNQERIVAEDFKNRESEEIWETLGGIAKRLNLDFKMIVSNTFSPRNRVSGYTNFKWTQETLLLPYFASRFYITSKKQRQTLTKLIGSNEKGFDAKFYGFNFLNGKGRDKNYTDEMVELFNQYKQIEDTDIIRKIKSLFPELDISNLNLKEQVDESSAIEGILSESKGMRRSRNKDLVDLCKKRDGFTCQVCGFSLKHNGKHVIDCHHMTPLSSEDFSITSVDTLISLCPTCHRIAHTTNPPLDIDEIKNIRLQTSYTP